MTARNDSTWEKVRRVDLAAGGLGERRRTQQGGLIAKATLTRTGVFSYRQPDGSMRRELRHPDEVFAPDSLATLAHATYTDDHPDKVHPDNWKHVAKGHVVDPKKDGKFVSGEIHIQDAEAIRKAEKGDLQENSCGYECRLDPTPGEYDGETYDAVQRDIRYNHVAGGPKNWGRAGPDVRLHLDGGAGVSGGDEGAPYVSSMPTAEELQIKLDAEKKRADDAVVARDTEAAKVRDLVSKVDSLSGQVDVMKTRVEAVDKTTRDSADQKRTDAFVDEYIGLVIEAGERLDTRDEKWNRKREDGTNKTVKEIRLEIVKHLEPTLKLDGKSDEYIAGACEAAVRRDNESRQGLEELQDITGGPSLYGIEGGRGRRDGGVPPQFRKKQKPAAGDDDDVDTDGTQDAQDAMLARMKSRAADGKRTPGFARDGARELPSRSAFNGGNSGRENAGGFGGGM